MERMNVVNNGMNNKRIAKKYIFLIYPDASDNVSVPLHLTCGVESAGC